METPTPVSLCLIVRDAEKTLDVCLESVIKPAYVGGPKVSGAAFDEIVILDTGSKDSTLDIIRHWTPLQYDLGGKLIWNSIVWPSDFAKARQASFDHASGFWRGWIDADDVFHGAEYVKNVLLRQTKPEHSCLLIPYVYAQQNGRVLTKLPRERFVRWGDGWQWVGRVHEHLMRIDRLNGRNLRMQDERMYVEHQATVEEIFSHLPRNDSLADPDGAENPAERQRLLCHVAQSILGSEPLRAQALLEEALAQPFADSYTKLICHYYLCDVLAGQEKWAEAREQAMALIESAPDLRKGYQALANLYHIQGNMSMARHWYAHAFQIPRKPEEFVIHDDSDEAQLYVNAMRLSGHFDGLDKILAEYPHLEKTSEIRCAIGESKTQKMQARSLEYAEWLVNHDEYEKANVFLSNLPYPICRNEKLALFRRRIDDYLDHHGALERDVGWRPLPDNIAQMMKDNEQCSYITARSRHAVERIKKLGWKNILSVGCCDGMVEGYIASQLPDVNITCYDRNKDAVEHGRNIWRGLPNLAWTNQEPNSVASFDGGLCFEVIEHLKFHPDMFDYLPFLFTTPAMQPDHGYPLGQFPTIGEAGHLRIFTATQIRQIYRPTRLEMIEESLCPLWFGQSEPLSHNASRHLVVFVCAHCPFAWGPETGETRGLTGSEECVVYLAGAMAKRKDMDVVVASSALEGGERIVDGVHWVPMGYLAELDRDQWNYDSTTVVIWRQPTVVTQPILASLRGVKKVLWLHDAEVGPVPPEVWRLYDQVVYISEYQRKIFQDQYGEAATAQGCVIQHGIPTMPTAIDKFDPHKAIYASSPDRGLLRLLRWWPEVHARLPQLKLHVFYGRNNMRALADYYPGLQKEIAEVDAKLKEMEPLGVIDRGLVPHQVLHEEFATGSVWLYPTAFPEVACLTAMKAQSAGCLPVYSPGGCLDETIQWGVRFWDELETLDSEEAKTAFISHLDAAVHRMLDYGPSIKWPSWDERVEAWKKIVVAEGE